MLGRELRAIRSLLFPDVCLICGEYVDSAVEGICIRCRYEIPLTHYWRNEQNPVKEHFDGLVPLVQGSSFIFYSGKGVWRDMVHRFKYGNVWRIAYVMGRWYGGELRALGLYNDVDVVVPVPLHICKLMKRGYNQSTYLAEGIARELGVKVDSRSVRRVRNNPSQAQSPHDKRWENVEGIFSVRRKESLRGKHILVVDDVLTTGATITTLIEAILTAVPDCRISVATLAVTRQITAIR